jgi:hypothetical protein
MTDTRETNFDDSRSLQVFDVRWIVGIEAQPMCTAVCVRSRMPIGHRYRRAGGRRLDRHAHVCRWPNGSEC